VLKERYAPGLPVEAALGVAIAALSNQGNGERSEINGSQLEVAVLMRGRAHRTFRRITGARLEEMLGRAAAGAGKDAAAPAEPADGGAAGNGSTDGTAEGEPPPGDSTAP